MARALLRAAAWPSWAMPLAILLVAGAAVGFAYTQESYALFVLALVGITIVVGVGLNILVGLAGQISLGHVGFYAIGAYVGSLLTLNGVSFWIALPAAALIAGLVGALLALPALRVSGPYLAMVTIAFAFIVEHGTVEWKGLTGGANGLAGMMPPSLGSLDFAEREMALLAIALATLALLLFHRLSGNAWGQGMRAVQETEVAAQSLGLNPVMIKTVAFALSAALAGLAGAVVAPLMMFISPGSFPFSQSILFLLAVVVGGAGSVFGPVVGAVITVVGPELLSSFAEYRLLLFGALLLLVLWVAPGGIIGALTGRLRSRGGPTARDGMADLDTFLRPADAQPLLVEGIGITFGGVKAASGVSFRAEPGHVTSVIGPNGAGKTTVLNMIGGFYRPDSGSIRLGGDLAGRPAWQVSRGGIARTFQTTQLFGAMSVLDNVLVGLTRGRLGFLFAGSPSAAQRAIAEALLHFVGYRGGLDARAGDLPHGDKRLVEIARALATRPRVLLLDEPAAGLMRADKDDLSDLLRRIAGFGLSVILVEHDMTLVMGISDHVVVLDAGRPIAEGRPAAIRAEPRVIEAYLGGTEMRSRPRRVPFRAGGTPVLTVAGLTAGYGAAPVLEEVGLDVARGEMVALLGANGAGKSTTMRAVSGLLRPVDGAIRLEGETISALEAHAIARRGLALVPEGRQLFPELSVRDNILIGAYRRGRGDHAAELDAILARFPRLRERLDSRAGLLSGGEQQMVAIARGLMAQPAMLLLDEPSLGLAPAMINELFDVLAGLRDEGVTILLVDQMASLALTVADRGYVLESGRVVRADRAEALASDPALEAAYLGAAAE
jgi:branched-chain amino acid transport system ATP-binding protein